MKLSQSKPEDLEGIIQLRQEVLHPGGPRDRVVYAQDSDEATVHLIYKNEEGAVLVTGTLILEDEEETESKGKSFRIRGMAVAESLRGQGIGSSLLEGFIQAAKEKTIKNIWCNARVKAMPLYERKGFVKNGNIFDVPGSGPHYRMRLKLKA